MPRTTIDSEFTTVRAGARFVRLPANLFKAIVQVAGHWRTSRGGTRYYVAPHSRNVMNGAERVEHATNVAGKLAAKPNSTHQATSRHDALVTAKLISKHVGKKAYVHEHQDGTYHVSHNIMPKGKFSSTYYSAEAGKVKRHGVDGTHDLHPFHLGKQLHQVSHKDLKKWNDMHNHPGKPGSKAEAHNAAQYERLKSEHEQAVRERVAAGKGVSKKALAEYPDLATPKAGKKAAQVAKKVGTRPVTQDGKAAEADNAKAAKNPSPATKAYQEDGPTFEQAKAMKADKKPAAPPPTPAAPAAGKPVETVAKARELKDEHKTRIAAIADKFMTAGRQQKPGMPDHEIAADGANQMRKAAKSQADPTIKAVMEHAAAHLEEHHPKPADKPAEDKGKVIDLKTAAGKAREAIGVKPEAKKDVHGQPVKSTLDENGKRKPLPEGFTVEKNGDHFVTKQGKSVHYNGRDEDTAHHEAHESARARAQLAKEGGEDKVAAAKAKMDAARASLHTDKPMSRPEINAATRAYQDAAEEAKKGKPKPVEGTKFNTGKHIAPEDVEKDHAKHFQSSMDSLKENGVDYDEHLKEAHGDHAAALRSAADEFMANNEIESKDKYDPYDDVHIGTASIAGTLAKEAARLENNRNLNQGTLPGLEDHTSHGAKPLPWYAQPGVTEYPNDSDVKQIGEGSSGTMTNGRRKSTSHEWGVRKVDGKHKIVRRDDEYGRWHEENEALNPGGGHASQEEAEDHFVHMADKGGSGHDLIPMREVDDRSRDRQTTIANEVGKDKGGAHNMTRDEFTQAAKDRGYNRNQGNLHDMHGDAVYEAAHKGDALRPEVLHDYPELQEAAKKSGAIADAKPTATTKAPHEMTRHEYIDAAKAAGFRGSDHTAGENHRANVLDAVRNGKRVSEDVVKDYPDLHQAAKGMGLVAPKPGASKAPHEMTPDEFKASPHYGARSGPAAIQHMQHIERAIGEGKSVPDHVLDAYDGHGRRLAEEKANPAPAPTSSDADYGGEAKHARATEKKKGK